MEYIRAHWRGKHSLARSYWINGVLLGFLAGAGILGLDYVLGKMWLGPGVIVVWILLLWSITFVFSIWQLVGVWRCAGQHKVLTGRRFWATLAQVAVVLGWIGLAKSSLNYGKVGWLAFEVAAELGPIDYRVELVDGDIHFSGDITYYSVEMVRELLSSSPDIDTLLINSPGGFTGPAMKLGSLVEQNGLTVIAVTQCESACTMPLVASPRPTVIPGTIIGFHRAGGVGIPQVEEEAVTALEEYYRAQGVDPEVIQRAISTPFENVWRPSLQQLALYGVVKYVFDTQTFEIVDAGDYCAARPGDCWIAGAGSIR